MITCTTNTLCFSVTQQEEAVEYVSSWRPLAEHSHCEKSFLRNREHLFLFLSGPDRISPIQGPFDLNHFFPAPDRKSLVMLFGCTSGFCGGSESSRGCREDCALPEAPRLAINMLTSACVAVEMRSARSRSQHDQGDSLQHCHLHWLFRNVHKFKEAPFNTTKGNTEQKENLRQLFVQDPRIVLADFESLSPGSPSSCLARQPSDFAACDRAARWGPLRRGCIQPK